MQDNTQEPLTLAEALERTLYDDVELKAHHELIAGLDKYLNDWKGRTPNESNLWLTRCDEISIHLRGLLEDETLILRPEKRREIENAKRKWETKRELLLVKIGRDDHKASPQIDSQEQSLKGNEATGHLQNYDNFIEEIRQLEITTIDRFVKDDQVLYNYDVKTYDDIPNCPADRLPGHRSTFLCLDRYDEHNTSNRYEDYLQRLVNKAENDLLALPVAQRRNQIEKLKREHERMVRIMKQSAEYVKAWFYNTLDDLPGGFIDQLMRSFSVPHLPEGSKDKKFAEQLDDAIKYKAGYLSQLIKHIGASLPIDPPAPIGLPNESKRPPAPPFANFTDKLQNGFTETDLNALLVRVNFKNTTGSTLRFTGYLMHDVIDELVAANYFKSGNREADQKALQRFLGLSETRVARGYSTKKSVKSEAKAYLLELKNKRKING